MGSIIKNLALILAILIALGGFLMHRILNDFELFMKFNDFIDSLDDSTEFNTKFNRYLAGNFAPVNEENLNIQLVEVEGKLPKNFSGLFLRVGPNIISDHLTKRYQLFDGHGMIHSIRFKNEEAFYSNQWIKTPRYLNEKKLKKPLFLMIGEMRGFLGLFKILVIDPIMLKFFNLTTLEKGQANTAMINHNSKLFACHEASLPFEIQWYENNSFKSLGFNDFGDLNFPVTAHSKIDPVDGKMYFSGYNFQAQSEAPTKFGSISASGDVLNYFPIDLDTKTWMHDMAISENFMFLLDSSVHFSPEGIMKGQFFSWNETHNLRIGAVPKTANSSDDVIWFEADKPYVIVHTMNAWEEENGEELVLICPLGDYFDGSLEENANQFYLSEVRMNLKTKKITVTRFQDSPSVEFPRVLPNYLGRKTQFGFSPEMTERDLHFNKIIKFDLFKLITVGTIKLPDGLIIGEPIPIPKTQIIPESGEDKSGEVYLGVFVFNEITKDHSWMLFDGETMDSNPVVVLQFPAGKKATRVPYGFHAEWVNEDALQKHLNQAMV